jgi:DNA-directed RNA polymerase specialized sigma24 family protein
MGFIDRACRNAVCAHFRRRPHCALDFDVADPRICESECHVDTERMEAWLYHALGGLRKLSLDVLVRYYFLDQGEAEICEATGLKPTTFRTIKRRGIERMRSRLPHRLFREGLAAA